MLLTVDIGNTNTLLGIFLDDELVFHWRLKSDARRTQDEYWVYLDAFFRMAGVIPSRIDGAIVSSVVPTLTDTFREMCLVRFGLKPLFVESGVKTGIALLVDNPKEVGADRIVNAVAAYERFHRACVVVDFGTATTFDVISERGEYLGGVIAPGIGISAEALFKRTSKLPRVELEKAGRVIGKNTIEHIQSGLVYGYASMVEGMLVRIFKELGAPCPVIATGGFAQLIASHTKMIEQVDELLTLKGLRMLFLKNRSKQEEEGLRP
jgi:type III pantothenate kinase